MGRRSSGDVPTLVARARSGDARSVARLISLVEDASPLLREVMAGLAPYSGSATISSSFEPMSPHKSIHRPRSKTRSRGSPSRAPRRDDTNSAAMKASARSTPYVLTGKPPMRKSSGYIFWPSDEL